MALQQTAQTAQTLDKKTDQYIEFMMRFRDIASALKSGRVRQFRRLGMEEIEVNNLKLNIPDLFKWFDEICETCRIHNIISESELESYQGTHQGLVRLSKYLHHGLPLFYNIKGDPVIIRMKDSTENHFLNLVGVYEDMEYLTAAAIEKIEEENDDDGNDGLNGLD